MDEQNPQPEQTQEQTQESSVPEEHRNAVAALFERLKERLGEGHPLLSDARLEGALHQLHQEGVIDPDPREVAGRVAQTQA